MKLLNWNNIAKVYKHVLLGDDLCMKYVNCCKILEPVGMYDPDKVMPQHMHMEDTITLIEFDGYTPDENGMDGVLIHRDLWPGDDSDHEFYVVDVRNLNEEIPVRLAKYGTGGGYIKIEWEI